MVVANVARPKAQYHYDIGYDGLFAHYRAEKPYTGDAIKVAEVLMNMKPYLTTQKKGILLSNLSEMKDLTNALEYLRDEGFYMVNFETKSMVYHPDNEWLTPIADCEINTATLC